MISAGLNHLDETDQQTIRSIIEAILLRHDTRRWSNANQGGPLTEIARRLGHSIDVLLRVCAGLFNDDEARANEAIDARLVHRDRNTASQH